MSAAQKLKNLFLSTGLLLAGTAMAYGSPDAQSNDNMAPTAPNVSQPAPPADYSNVMSLKITKGPDKGKVIFWDCNQPNAIGELSHKYGVDEYVDVSGSNPYRPGKKIANVSVAAQKVAAPSVKAASVKVEPVKNIPANENNMRAVPATKPAQTDNNATTVQAEKTTVTPVATETPGVAKDNLTAPKPEIAVAKTETVEAKSEVAEVSASPDVLKNITPRSAEFRSATEKFPQQDKDGNYLNVQGWDPLAHLHEWRANSNFGRTQKNETTAEATNNTSAAPNLTLDPAGNQAGGQVGPTGGQTFDPNKKTSSNELDLIPEFWDRGGSSDGIQSYAFYLKQDKWTFYWQRLTPNQWVPQDRQYWASVQAGTSTNPFDLKFGVFLQGKKDDKNTMGGGWGFNIASGEREVVKGVEAGRTTGPGEYTTMSVGAPVNYDGRPNSLAFRLDSLRYTTNGFGNTNSANISLRGDTHQGLSLFGYTHTQIGQNLFMNVDAGINRRGAGVMLNFDQRLGNSGFGLGFTQNYWSNGWQGGANDGRFEIYYGNKLNLSPTANLNFGVSWDTKLWGNNALYRNNGGNDAVTFRAGLTIKF